MSTSTPSEPSATSLLLDIEGPAAGGTSIARHDGRVVFVSGALPGERVRAELTGPATGRLLRAEVAEVLAASPYRVADRRALFATPSPDSPEAVPHFGGMEYAHVDLARSRELKAQIVRDQLARIGRLDREVVVEPAPGETDGLDWRTRVQLAIDGRGRAGMLAARSHDVVALHTAPLACPEIAEIDLTSFALPGATRLELAWAGDHGAAIVRGDAEAGSVDALAGRLGAAWSILVEEPAPGTARNRTGRRGGRSRGARRGGSRPVARELRVVSGSSDLVQTVHGQRFRVAADGFWQVHHAAAGLLSSAVAAAVPDGTRTITDLYCGVGLLGITAAREHGTRLFGIEGTAAAIDAARANADGIDASFAVGRVDRTPIPDAEVIVLDPPRAGAGAEVVDALLASSAHTLISVSCDAGTLSRDLSRLVAGGFRVESLRGIDLFPLTAHLETVTVLRR